MLRKLRSFLPGPGPASGWRTPHMSRPHRPIPKHCHHKASGRGVVRLSGKDHYTGPWGTPAAEAAYERLLAEWLANGRSAAAPEADPPAGGAAPSRAAAPGGDAV